VLSVGARYLLAGRFLEEGRTMMRMGVGMLALLTPIQLFIGDQHGLNTLEHQPMKIAAVEGHWDGSEPGALVLFAWPDAKAETNRFEIAIPKLGSLIVTHDPDGLYPGLLSVPPDDRPPIVPVFFAFRAMVGVGVLMLAAGWIGAFLWWRGRLFDSRWYLQPLAWGWWLGFVAVISGWIVTETGRQPWLAYGILRTADATSPVLGSSILTTLVLFVLVYGIVFAMGIYYINRLIHRGPEGRSIEPPELATPARPLSTVVDAEREILSPQR